MSHPLTLIFSVLFFPLTLLASWVVIHPQEQKVVLFWGRLRGVIKEPGIVWVNLWGRKVITVSTKRQTLELPRTTVADGNGNPIQIAGVVTYEYVAPLKVALEVEDAHDFVKTQAMAVLKQIASKYPYESPDGHSLKAEAQAIGQEMVAALQTKVEPAGTRVLSYELSDLSYAPEIAQAMLVRQQAQALVDARKIVVEGAVQIVNDSVSQLSTSGHELTPRERAALVSSLLVVICGESHVQPTYSIASSGGGDEHGPRMIGLLEEIRANTKRPAGS
ncbi:MAG: SPFH domain-containing protein [Planctomycetes bacterium]|nr:SPFH domain-containing protein [Planctomycetota bacterium]